jgi:uncharacterized protein (DUF342 family)
MSDTSEQLTIDGLNLIERGVCVVAIVAPAENRAPLSANTVREMLAQGGYENWDFLDDSIDMLVDRWATRPDDFEIAVAEKRDASIHVGVASDSSLAWVQVLPARGGKALQRTDVMKALQDAGVVFGIDEKAVLQVCKAVVPAKVEVAWRKSPVDGQDADFKVLINTVHDRAPKVDENGMIDFRELGDIPFVNPGTPLMRRIPATPGVEGKNVRGIPIPATPGRDHAFAAALKGVRLSPGDPNVLEADVKGQPVAVEHGMLVEDLLNLTTVDMDSGNVSFDGSIQIKGDVLAGMKVKVTGNIVIGGTVEGAELEAGGDIQVGRGIIAGSKVKAEGQVSCKFTENSVISAGTVISIDDMSMQSDLEALNQILIGVKSAKRGKLIGGSARAMMLVRVPQIGSDMSGLTTVQVGMNPLLETQLIELQGQIAKTENDLDGLKKVVQHLKASGDKNNMLPRAQASLLQAQQNFSRLMRDKSKIDSQMSMFHEAKIEISQGAEGTVSIAFGKRARRLQKPYDAGFFKLDPNGYIIHVDARGSSTVVQ